MKPIQESRAAELLYQAVVKDIYAYKTDLNVLTGYSLVLIVTVVKWSRSSAYECYASSAALALAAFAIVLVWYRHLGLRRSRGRLKSLYQNFFPESVAKLSQLDDPSPWREDPWTPIMLTVVVGATYVATVLFL